MNIAKRFRKIAGYVLYVLFSWMPHYQLGHTWLIPLLLRRVAGKILFDKCGKKADVGRKIKMSMNISLGNNSGIGDYSYFIGKVSIGNDVMIGPKVMFLAANHNFSRKDVPMNKQGDTKKGIIVDDDVWIGARSIILDGVHLRKGTIVGAGAVVTKDTEEYSIVAGCPAKKIGQR